MPPGTKPPTMLAPKAPQTFHSVCLSSVPGPALCRAYGPNSTHLNAAGSPSLARASSAAPPCGRSSRPRSRATLSYASPGDAAGKGGGVILGPYSC